MRILVTGARSPFSLDLVRLLHRSGHWVATAETSRLHPPNFSNAVRKSFVVPSPRFKSDAFIDKLVQITKDENIDLVIPTFEEIFYISRGMNRFPPSCKVFCSSPEMLNRLHNKWLFYVRQRLLGVDAPEAVLIRSTEELRELKFPRPFALKAAYSRAFQHMHKVEDGQPLPDVQIDDHNPWIAQQWLHGRLFCTYSICHEGEVFAHTAYPLNYSIDNKACASYRAVEHPGIEEWVRKFVGLEKFTGQIAFDFIEQSNGEIHAIECNPRCTAGVHLFSEGQPIDKAFTGEATEVLRPVPGTQRQLMIAMLMYGWRHLPPGKSIWSYFKQLFTTKDVLFRWNDLGPFLGEPLMFSRLLFKAIKARVPVIKMFSHDIEWDGKQDILLDLAEDEEEPALI